ncbi:Ribosomal RNA small subunit methyltransferase B [Candidatus Ecksteinia adelgidicola]|nr:Ribosomal RNA small subunit methyltransferase B [Candidatus Ecksteinia adelgidicola]
MKNNYNLRSYSAKIINKVLNQGQLLNNVLPNIQKDIINIKDRALLQELCFGILRVLPKLEWYIQFLMVKPMIGSQRILHYLIMVGLYQLLYTRIPAYAAISETVKGTILLNKSQFKGTINAVLREFQRQKKTLIYRPSNHDVNYLHPSWLLNRIKKTYPKKWKLIINANNQKPPMWIRINRLHHTRETYLKLMKKDKIFSKSDSKNMYALRLLKPCTVTNLPGFVNGWVTVQDISSQHCVILLEPKNGEKILDLCAAPGGKTTHILEIAPKSKVTAIDINKKRLVCLKKNLQRLNLHAEIILGDARKPELWCNNKEYYDRILVDAPCSSTGVIRRHPDIKWLRRETDINQLVILQSDILLAIWPYLKLNGVMIYSTCSILPEENEKQVVRFMNYYNNAKLVKNKHQQQLGEQHLPFYNNSDGFFYAKFVKI